MVWKETQNPPDSNWETCFQSRKWKDSCCQKAENSTNRRNFIPFLLRNILTQTDFSTVGTQLQKNAEILWAALAQEHLARARRYTLHSEKLSKARAATLLIFFVFLTTEAALRSTNFAKKYSATPSCRIAGTFCLWLRDFLSSRNGANSCKDNWKRPM